ncbi:MAG TPA: hypothetical protein VMZ91_06660 [Candidatus Paceibacterota bacterium]|nr:hypothetical protein [Candidatus Paceibacterota bacterium]
MFKLNEVITTKKGEKLKPFLVQNNMVYCFTSNGQTVIKELTEFDHTPKKEKEVIVVTPVLETTDEFYEVDTPIDPPIDEPIVENPPIDEPIVEDPPIDEPIVENPPVDEPIVENPPVNITIDDDDYV